MLTYEKLLAVVGVVVFHLSFIAVANQLDVESLDPNPPKANPIVEEAPFLRANPFRDLLDRAVNNLKASIYNQTGVKAQGYRGTCSIFSATATLESLLKIELGKELDLSENYLEYLVMSRMKSAASEGSDTPLNIPAFQKYGTIFSTTWPYEEYDWTSNDLPQAERTKAQRTCGQLMGNRRKACLLSHMDPGQDRYRNQALSFGSQYGTGRLRYQTLKSQSQIRQVLNSNRPLILSVEFFYKAWNHRKMVEYGLGQRNMKQWERGVVNAPTAFDVQVSRKHPAGHSFVLVGYDDQARVYYFKNSWGTEGFGQYSDFLGANTTAGYGTISYDYAHSFGSFYYVGFGRN